MLSKKLIIVKVLIFLFTSVFVEAVIVDEEDEIELERKRFEEDVIESNGNFGSIT